MTPEMVTGETFCDGSGAATVRSRAGAFGVLLPHAPTYDMIVSF